MDEIKPPSQKTEFAKSWREKKIMWKVQTEKFNLWFKNNHVLKDIDFEIGENAVTAIMGPSDCGKSTLLRSINRMNDLILGVEHPDNLEKEIIFRWEVKKNNAIDFSLNKRKIRLNLPSVFEVGKKAPYFASMFCLSFYCQASNVG